MLSVFAFLINSPEEKRVIGVILNSINTILIQCPSNKLELCDYLGLA